MPRAIQSVARSLLRVAKHSVIEFFRVDSGALDRTFAGDRAQFLRREIFQLAAIAAKGRPRPTHNCNVTWFQHDFLADPRSERIKVIIKLISVAAQKQIWPQAKSSPRRHGDTEETKFRLKNLENEKFPARDLTDNFGEKIIQLPRNYEARIGFSVTEPALS
jgi:hypothetical protein